jgi:transcriptional regulator CtsR
VLTTRFTCERGYVIESRRGGGGCIVIKQVSYDGSEERNNLLYDYIGNSITNNSSLSLVESLVEADLITIREEELIKMAINDRTLASADDRNRVRADILKALLIVILS